MINAFCSSYASHEGLGVPFVVKWFWFIKAPNALPATPNQFLVFKEASAPIALVIYPASTCARLLAVIGISIAIVPEYLQISISPA